MIDKKCVCGEIEKARDWRMTQDNVMTLAALLYIKEHMPEHEQGHSALGDTEGEHCELTREEADRWVKSMKNADGTYGPHWTIEETDKLHKQYGLTCDNLEFWAVLNSVYSDYCEALRESGISTPEVYVRLAKAWINDKDAVPNKAAAYYTHIVKH